MIFFICRSFVGILYYYFNSGKYPSISLQEKDSLRIAAAKLLLGNLSLAEISSFLAIAKKFTFSERF